MAVLVFRLIEALVLGLGAWFVITQLIMPAVRGEPSFPMFRGKTVRDKHLEEETEVTNRLAELERRSQVQEEVKKRIERLERKVEDAPDVDIDDSESEKGPN